MVAQGWGLVELAEVTGWSLSTIVHHAAGGAGLSSRATPPWGEGARAAKKKPSAPKKKRASKKPSRPRGPPVDSAPPPPPLEERPLHLEKKSARTEAMWLKLEERRRITGLSCPRKRDDPRFAS